MKLRSRGLSAEPRHRLEELLEIVRRNASQGTAHRDPRVDQLLESVEDAMALLVEEAKS
jgi:hypothetical protein